MNYLFPAPSLDPFGSSYSKKSFLRFGFFISSASNRSYTSKIAVLKHALKKNTVMYASRKPASMQFLVALGTILAAPMIYKIKKISDRNDEVRRQDDKKFNKTKPGTAERIMAYKNSIDSTNKRVKDMSEEAVDVSVSYYKMVPKVISPTFNRKSLISALSKSAVDIIKDEKDEEVTDD